MRVRASRFVSVAVAALLLVISSRAAAQSCCAGSSAITPGRLALHEDALIGLQLRAASLVGSYDYSGRYRSSAAGSSEQDFEQDVVGALRFLRRAQLAVLVPFVQTRRTLPVRAEFGGGIGDVNVSVRYDFLDARRSSIVPGLALLLGVTLLTGVPVESADKIMATDATGIGALQTNAAVALEKNLGSWTVGVAGLVAKRWSRDVQGLEEKLSAQWTLIAAAAYAFESELAIAASAAYAVEGDATIDGVEQRDSSRRLLTTTVSTVFPVSDHWRVQGTAFVNPPASSFGSNQNALAGLSLMLIYAWL